VGDAESPLPSDDALRVLLAENPERGWRVFVDRYTPLLMSLIARAGVGERDDVADVYLRVCERLADDSCARLRRHDPRKGPLAAWLTVLVRNVVVDWVRSRGGRRRLFGAIRRLDALDQRVFELYYWNHRRPEEIAARLHEERGTPVELVDVLGALQRVQDAMTDRHRGELLALLARTRGPVSLDDEEAGALAAAGPADDPERAAQVRELDALFTAALATLPPEDAAIVRLTFVQGWSRRQVQRALHLDRLTPDRMTGILERLREACRARRIRAVDAVTPGLSFLEGPSR
jgi:DNA-directed RNA polymerase specialized sigma24 family protein